MVLVGAETGGCGRIWLECVSKTLQGYQNPKTKTSFGNGIAKPKSQQQNQKSDGKTEGNLLWDGYWPVSKKEQNQNPPNVFDLSKTENMFHALSSTLCKMENTRFHGHVQSDKHETRLWYGKSTRSCAWSSNERVEMRVRHFENGGAIKPNLDSLNNYIN